MRDNYGNEANSTTIRAAYDTEEEARNNMPKNIRTDYSSIKFKLDRVLVGHKTVADIEAQSDSDEEVSEASEASED